MERNVKLIEKQKRKQFRRWIFKAISNDQTERGVTFRFIKNFLESKEEGVADRPEIKVILKRALDKGEILKLGARYSFKQVGRRRRKRSSRPGRRAKVSRRRSGRRKRSGSPRRGRKRSSKRKSSGRRRSRRRGRKAAAAAEEE